MMKRYRVTWEVEVDAMTPGGARAVALNMYCAAFDNNGAWFDIPPLTVTAIEDGHTTRFDPHATDALR